MPIPTEVLVQASFLRGPRFISGPAGILAQVYSLEGPILTPRFTEFSGSCFYPNRSRTHVWTCRGLWLLAILSEVAPLYLLLWSLLSQVCSGLGH